MTGEVTDESSPPTRMQSPLEKSMAVTTPMGMAVASMQGYLEEVGQITKIDPQDAWLPITESRNGNAYYSTFHCLCSGIGFQVLVLPVAFTFLGWIWGTLCLTLAFIWQIYTLWLLVQLHESATGIRYCRYIHLAKDCFGKRLGTLLAKFPTMYLSGGTCAALVVVGGGNMKLFFEIACGPTCQSKPLSAIEWYLVFLLMAVILSQLPNLNSLAGVSLAGAITAVSYCTIIWAVSIRLGRLPQTSYTPVDGRGRINRVLDIVNAIGIITFAFRGHNLVLEIQIPPSGILHALFVFHGHDTSRVVLGLTCLLVVINCLSSFQIYAMPVFDNLEAGYTGKNNKPCPRWLRSGFRAFFGSVVFLIAVAFPFLSDLAGLLGGIALPVTLAYPCFMWIVIKKPEKFSAVWCVNWALGSLGMGLSAVLVVGGLWRLIDIGQRVWFFKAQ
ncbi:hypothetical protein IEQ34_006404 [Dendrobium chrysotoxum]|uniref:Amino acid transporter transmembrane domain-containing protein n=1 Tax=Dendrobium chrysotoxum TaxID=161865 RepID=A0AAV7HBM2_DENCH|nr:hypothetical protein IEQ34_006404 [Dendrobium chrysotoxum]